MPNSAKSRPHSDHRFYYPPAVRRQQEQQLLLQQQHLQLQRQLQRPAKVDYQPQSVESEATTALDDSDNSALSKANSVCYSPTRKTNLTYLDRLLESVTPSVRAHFLPEVRLRGRQRRETDLQRYFFLVDFWESLCEWSVYGVGVPLELNESEPIQQYYVPSLSGIQLYIDPNRASNTESLRQTTSVANNDYEVERQTKGIVDGMQSQLQQMSMNSHKMNGFKGPLSSSSFDAVNTGSSVNGQLIYEYFEYEKPHNRRPLYDQISLLASQFPDLKKYRSCDLSPESWISVAWYPIYRIPVGPTLQNMDASFLTFHCLSTTSKSKVEEQPSSTSRNVNSGDASSTKLSIPVFGLASYKLRCSILMPKISEESQEVISLIQVADDWLRRLQGNGLGTTRPLNLAQATALLVRFSNGNNAVGASRRSGGSVVLQVLVSAWLHPQAQVLQGMTESL